MPTWQQLLVPTQAFFFAAFSESPHTFNIQSTSLSAALPGSVASTNLTCSHIYISRYHHAPYSQTRGSVIAIESHTSIVDVPT
ncbi:hypothetical protein QCA50_006362 [Cerrena zonata]|uniref:Secreted protein n=1 Tax=Cerrena zonata TaxID=2478898 RepID=A0AAW0G7V7_9APHY